MRFPRRRDRSNPGLERLGLDSVRFDTLGLARHADETSNERVWLGPNLVLSENWFPIPPDLPSLDETEIRSLYDALLGQQRDAEGRAPRLLHLAVHREAPVPAVRTLILEVLAEEGRHPRHIFIGAITLPLAECSWVIKTQAVEGQMTGVRESVAFARYSKERPELSFEDRVSSFDPYDAQWDLDEELDPLTSVRKSMDRVYASLEWDPAVLSAPRFRP